MRVINSKLHGVLDYVVGAFLVVSPWVLKIDTVKDASWLLTISGILTIVYSLFTNYEAGLFRKIPMSVHLTLDLMSGLFIGISPWTLGFADEVWLPHLIIGATEVLVVVLTQPKMIMPEKTRVIR